MHPVFRLQQAKAGAPLPERLSHSALNEIELCTRRWRLLHSQYDELTGPYPEPVFATTVMGIVVHGALKAFADALRGAGSPAPGSIEFVDVRRTFPLRAVVRQLRREALDHLANNHRVDIATLSSVVSVDGDIAAFKRLIMQAYSGDVNAQPDRESLRNIARASISGKQAASGVSPLPEIKSAQNAELDLGDFKETDTLPAT